MRKGSLPLFSFLGPVFTAPNSKFAIGGKDQSLKNPTITKLDITYNPSLVTSHLWPRQVLKRQEKGLSNAHSRQVSNCLPREENPSWVCKWVITPVSKATEQRTQQVSGIGAREGTKTRDLFPLQKKRGEKSTGQGKKRAKASTIGFTSPESPKEATQRNKRKIFSPKETLVKTHLLKHKKFHNT